MVANAITVVTGVISAMGEFLNIQATEGIVAGTVASIAALFALPLLVGTIGKVKKLIKGAR